MELFDEARELYTETLKIDPLNAAINSKLFFNRALMNKKMFKIDEAIDDCGLALELDPIYLKAILLRAHCYNALSCYEQAVKDYEEAVSINPSDQQIKEALKDARIALKQSHKKDYYEILGIRKEATVDEIKIVYKKCARRQHPDKHNATEDEKRQWAEKFKEMSEAHRILLLSTEKQ